MPPPRAQAPSPPPAAPVRPTRRASPLRGPARFIRRLGGNLARAARVGAAAFVLPRAARFWLTLRLSAPLAEGRPPRLPFGRETPLGLLDLLTTLAAAAADPRVAGVLLQLDGVPRGFAAAMALRRAVDDLRAAGKPVAAYGERLGLAEYWLASGADRLWLPETGSLQLLGLRAEGVYLRGLLRRLGVEPEVVRVGSHKTAGELFTRESMSREQRGQLEALLDDLYTELVSAVASGRDLTPDAVRERIDRGPYGGSAAVEHGLADACLYPDQLEEALGALAPATLRPDAPGVRQVAAPLYHTLHAADPGWRPWLRDLPRVAYVVAQGTIRREPGLRGGIAVEPLRELLERLARDDGVRGVVVRLASPGGDALASDLLWRALHRAGGEKPVVVSMGEVAASGGYLAAVAASAVLAEASTLTGSIGVVGGKVNLAPLYEKLGVARDAVERGRRAGLLSEARGFSAEERAAVREEMRAVYEIFLRRVEEGRGLARPEVERAAQGRLWSGSSARRLGLVDALGGPLEALREVRRRAGIDEAERVLVELHPRRAPLTGLRVWLGLGLRGR